MSVATDDVTAQGVRIPEAICSLCGNQGLLWWVELGDQPLANGLRRPGEPAAPVAPVVVGRCVACCHTQLAYRQPPAALYPAYPYRAGVSQAWMHHCLRLARDAVTLTNAKRVLDIGANDGTLLLAFLQAGVPIESLWGVDYAPAPRIPDLQILEGAFPDVAPDGAFDVIACTNTLNAIEDLHGFMSAIQARLSPEGLLIIEVPYLADVVAGVAFDTFYHEHRHYWLVATLQRLLLEHGLEMFDVDHVPFQGGSLSITAGHLGAYPHARGPFPWPWWEDHAGYHGVRAYAEFPYEAHRQKFACHQVLRDNPGKWCGYGAAAKATALCAYYGLGVKDVPVVFDDTPAKQGLLTPWGAEVKPLDALDDVNPDGIILFARNVADELVAKLRAKGWHGRVLVPLPRARVEVL